MRTLADIDADELAARERAWSYQRTKDSLLRAQQEVERLTPRVEAYSRTLSQLDAIEAVSSELPPDVIGKDGLRARDQIAMACASARAHTTNHQTKDTRALNAAIEAIPRLEAQLAMFTD